MKKHWFAAKKYGLGWVPIAWQGWAITAGYALLIVGSSLFLAHQATYFSANIDDSFSSDELFAAYFAWVLLLTASMMWVCYRTGEPLEWHWGTKNKTQ